MKKQNLLIYVIIFLSIVMIVEGGLLYRNHRTDEKDNNTVNNTIENIEDNETTTDDDTAQNNSQEIIEPKKEEPVRLEYSLSVDEEYETIYNPGGSKGYRYGPSIMKHEDGTMDMWMSRPGNNSTRWDYIAYRHYNGNSWSDEVIVLRPTSGSKDQCSVCDPAAIYFDGYYYLGYTGTEDYEHEGMNNSAFVARSKYPDGPFEKWNGSSWGGNPEPIVTYWDDPSYWGIGELSFVIKDEQLYIYYTLINKDENSVRLVKSGLSDDWPLTIQSNTIASYKGTEDSYDVVYDDNLDTFLAFSIFDRMKESSQLIMFESLDGREFKEADYTKTNIKDYSHNMGIAKSESGHINSDEPQLIGYAYGKEWGSWPLILQCIQIDSFTN